MSSRSDQVRQIKIALANPVKLADVLGLIDGASVKQLRGVIVRCPAHGDRGRPNLSITSGPDGTARVKCHACGYKSDALGLVATVHGLDTSREFKRALVIAAELAGQNDLAAEIGDGKPRPDRIRLPEPRQIPEAPWAENVAEFWESCRPITSSPHCGAYLEGRGIDPMRVSTKNLARCLPVGPLPRWCFAPREEGFLRARNWRESGHRMVVRSFDADGNLRSVRGWRVIEGGTPKRLPPCGRRSAGLILADRLGYQLLTGAAVPRTLWIVEGEPDWLAASLAVPGGCGVWGIMSGTWSDNYAKKASQVARVMVATHADRAGDQYAENVLTTVKRSTRWRPPKDLDELREELPALMGAAAKWLNIPHVLGE